MPEGAAEGKAAEKKPARPWLEAWEGEVNPDAVNEIVLDYIRAYDWIEMEDQGITEIQQAERLGMSRQRLHDLHHEVKTVTIPTLVLWCNRRHRKADTLLRELTEDLPHT